MRNEHFFSPEIYPVSVVISFPISFQNHSVHWIHGVLYVFSPDSLFSRLGWYLIRIIIMRSAEKGKTEAKANQKYYV